tara:strand:+ start:4514 stop:4999 length:486 start_codon:yes stop_codon:yes gene_type:complete
MITQKELKEATHYSPETGDFTWLKRPSNRVKVGDVAGYIAPDGYVQIRINNILYKSHRLAFLYMEGEFPVNIIDHINHDPSDNKWLNLRHADRFLNQKNMKLSKRNSSGISGVSKRNKRWQVIIHANGKSNYIGSYISKSDAVEVRNKTYKDLGFSPTHGI